MDWSLVIEILKEINIAQIVLMGLMFWFFYSRLNAKIKESTENLEKKLEKSENGLGARIDRLSERVDKLSERVEDIARRLCRIEGSLASQGHCLFSQNQAKDKVQ